MERLVFPLSRNLRRTTPLEAEFQATIIEWAEHCKWRCFHVTRVKGHLRNKTAVGFPDLVMVRRATLIFAELKRSAKEQPSPEQKVWLAALRFVATFCLGHLQVYVWRPNDWDEIERVLR